MLPNLILLAVAAGPTAAPPERGKTPSTIVVEGQRDNSSAVQHLSSASGATVDGVEPRTAQGADAGRDSVTGAGRAE
jgi:iron complex outermembrane receptor protein